MTHAAFLRFLVTQFESEEIPFMISGSVASGYHGEPRSTYDIDIVLDADQSQIQRLVDRVKERCYVSPESALVAARDKTMFNVIDLQTGVKADLILRKDRPFSVTEFGRRQEATISGVQAFIVTAEDCILSKLEWSALGESQRQFDDALKIARVASDRIDVAYLKKWASELGVTELLSRLLKKSALD